MEGFLDILKGLTSSFAQGGFIIAGMAGAGLGAYLLGNSLKWKSRGAEVEGTVTGVKRHGDLFYPVYRYSFPDTGINEAMADEGTADARGIETGAIVKLIVSRENPHVAHVVGRPLWPLLGAALLAAGLALLGYAFTAWPVNGVTWAVMLFFVLYSAKKMRHLFGSRKHREILSLWRQRQWEDVLDAPAETIETIKSDPQEGRRIRVAGQMQNMLGLLFTVAGAVALAGALYISAGKAELVLAGHRAEGKVVQLAGDENGGKKYLYFPVVTFTAKDGSEFTFQDKKGDNPAAYDEGETVSVLYLKKTPQESAALDGGIKDWIAPGLMGLFGTVFLLGGMSMMPRQRDEMR